MKKKTIGSVLIVIIAIIAAFLRFNRRMERINKNEERRKIVEQAEAVKKTQNIINNEQNTKTAEFLKSIADKNKNKSTPSYDEYTPVEVNLGIGKKDNKYFIVDGKANTSTEIKDVQNVYVLYINDLDYSQEYKGIFIQDNKGWKVIDQNQKVLADLGQLEINSKSKFEIKNNKISVK